MAYVLDHQRVFKDGEEIVPDFEQLSVLELLNGLANKNPQKEVLLAVEPGEGVKETLNYQDFFDQVKAVASLLQHQHGLQVGDSVGLHLENAPEILIFHLACWLIGCQTVPLDLKRDDDERKQYKLELTDCNLVVISDTEAGRQEIDSLTQLMPDLKLLPMSAEMRQQLVSETKQEANYQEDPHHTGLILFTSGTTNLPKGVQLSVANLLLNAEGIKEWLEITEEDRFHIVLPLHHINSTTMSLATLLAGGTIILSSRYSKSNFWRVMAEQRCTLSSIVPTICFDMLSEGENFAKYQDQLSQVTRIQIGSAPVTSTDAVKFVDRYGIRLVQGYGSTETALRVAGNRFSDLNDEQYRELVKANAIGRELKWNNLAILKTDGSEAAADEGGEICIRGPIVTKGYLANDQANEEAFIDGWFHSGDVGYWRDLLGEKTFFISGRQKEIIIKGGVNISPLMIEHAILENYPEVSTCFAAGCPDQRYGEEIGLVVAFDDTVDQGTQDQVLQQLKQDAQQSKIKGVAEYESPKYIFSAPLDSLPKTSTGKIQRVKIKEYFQSIFELIAEIDNHYFRRLTPFDTDHLAKLVEIHNARWGEALGIDIETATEAAANGIVIGAIDKETDQLAGSAFAERIHGRDVEHQADWLGNYASATGNLTLKPHTDKGDALLLVTISTAGKPFSPSTTADDLSYQALLKDAPSKIDQHLASGTDPVLSFHAKAKAGMQQGASVLYPIVNARPADVEALGYCVMIKYPELPDSVAIQPDASLGTQIIEAAFVYAVQNGVKQAYAYSRPSGFLKSIS